MNTVDAIEIVRDLAASSWHASAEERQAIEITARLVAAYDALAPDWSQAPEWAQWCAVVPGGRALWSETPLVLLPEGDGWTDEDAIGLWSRAGWIVDLPLGVDWRLCKWQRPEEPQP